MRTADTARIVALALFLAPLLVQGAACSFADPQPLPPPMVGVSTAPIIGGVADTTHAFAVGIEITGKGVCSGTLIAPNLVLTARHCVSQTTRTIDCRPSAGLETRKVLSNLDRADFRVSTAQDYRKDPSWDVSAIYYPNDATCTDAAPADIACRLCGFDLALLELAPDEAGALPKSWIAPSNVPPPRGSSHMAIGYGCQRASEDGCDPRGFRRSLDGVIVQALDTRDFHVRGRVCGGDSGGPLFDPIAKVVYGALSRGDGATETSSGCTYGLYTRTDAHIDWLQKYGALAAKHGGYAAPAWVTAPKPPPSDAGVDVPPAKSALGGSCKGPLDCLSGLCVELDGVRRCSQKCSATAACPASFDCIDGFCWSAGAAPPPGADDAGPPADASNRKAPDTADAASPAAASPTAAPPGDGKSGCAIGLVGSNAPPPRPVPWRAGAWFPGILAIAAGALARRRRRAMH